LARTRYRVPREMCASVLLPSKQQDRQRASTLGCGLGRPTWLVECGRVRDQVSASSGAHRDVLLPSGVLGLGGSSAGRLHVPPSFILSRGPFFSGERCRGILPSIRPFYRSPDHYPGVHCTHLSAAELPAVIHGLFARGSEGSLCLCRQMRGPSSGLWPGCWAPCGRFH
jgi:hypothetical protein